MGINNFKRNKVETKNENTNFDYKPNDICFLQNLTEDSYAESYSENKFDVFQSINDILTLVYSNINYTIIFYNIIDNKKIIEIKKAHSYYITNLRHYLDKIKEIDYLISASSSTHNIKLWNINTFECLFDLNNFNTNGKITSACFLNENNQNYVLTCNFNLNNLVDSIKVFDFKGKKIKEIKDSNENAHTIINFYDNKTKINYIITGNDSYVKSYNYNKNKKYRIYNTNSTKDEIHSVKIDNNEEVIKLLGSCGDGYIRVWNFHSGGLIKKINCKDYLNCLCLWNNEYVFVGCDNKLIKLVNLKTGDIVDIISHNNYILDIKKIIHPKYGQCLISQGNKDDQIKLWVVPK